MRWQMHWRCGQRGEPLVVRDALPKMQDGKRKVQT